MEGWNAPHPKKKKARKKRGPERENTEPPEVDHEPENAGEPSPLVFPKPRRIHLHHSRPTERLHVAIHSTDRDKQTEQAPERCHTEKDVHDDSACRADEHGAFAAEAICEQAVYDQAARVGKKRGGDDRSICAFEKPNSVLIAWLLNERL